MASRIDAIGMIDSSLLVHDSPIEEKKKINNVAVAKFQLELI
jgi:hypothetical protein